VNSVFCFDEFELDCGAFTLRHLGEVVRIDVNVLRVLQALVRRAGQVLSKEQLMSEVWNGRVATDNALTVAVSRLRKLLGERGMPRAGILTAHGHGYRFTRKVSSYTRDAELASSVEPHDAEFVGRKHLMLQLTEALAYAQHGCGRLVALRGEAGAGKTRAVEAFARYAAHSACTVAWARCRESATMPPLWPFVELLREMASTLPGAQLSLLLSDLAARTEHIRQEPPGLHQLFDAIACLLGTGEKGTTRVLILDDLPNADETSLQLLHYLLPLLSRMHVLVIATMRCDAATNPTRLAALAHRNCVRITIGPLSHTDVKSYIIARVGSVDDALSRRVYELSEGNPYSMVELVRQLRDGRTWHAAELSAPDLTRELVCRRLIALDEDAREVLTYAAVIGRVFGLPLLAAVTARSAVELMAMLDSAGTAKIVQTVADSRTEFTFAHGLLRSALYDEQSASQRRMRHLRVARILEQRRSLAEVSSADIAYHVLSSPPKDGVGNAADDPSRHRLLLHRQCRLGGRASADKVRERSTQCGVFGADAVAGREVVVVAQQLELGGETVVADQAREQLASLHLHLK
jgi:DNA-binding winged helix-turn-helix (wHTH) protein